MQSLPVVSIIGRPNVGKSSLFNRILRQKIAVVDDMPGVTRDRNFMKASWNGIDFLIADTGGMDITDKNFITREINRKVDEAIEESHVIVFIVDAKTDPTDLDIEIARILRKKNNERVILAVNKAESSKDRLNASIYFSLGLGEPMFISALHGMGVGDLLDNIVKKIKDNYGKIKVKDAFNPDLSIAVLGRPNAGKSSFVNKILNKERVIVSDIPGTTRDAIDSDFNYNGKIVRIIDTAGLRKKAKVKDNVEYYSNLRALNSITKSDVCILLVDALHGIGEQDLKILHLIQKSYKGLILCFNKWDAVEKDDKTFDKMVKEVKAKYMELNYVPVLSISALTGLRVKKVLDMAFEIKNKMNKQLSKKELEDRFHEWVRANPHPFVSNKEVRFLGIKQQKKDIPVFMFFCTNPTYVTDSYKRFLLKKINENFDFIGCTVKFIFKAPGRSNKKSSMAPPMFKKGEKDNSFLEYADDPFED